jgi:small nuclear ribonucleoprotein D2
MDESQQNNTNTADENSDPDALKSGPFSLLYDAVKNNLQILINVRNNHKYIARVKAYDRHMNLYVCPTVGRKQEIQSVLFLNR